MSKREYWIVVNQEIMEVDSILDVRTEADDEIWEQIVAGTCNLYIMMKAMNKSESYKMNKEEVKVMRMLKRSVLVMEKTTPEFFIDINIEKAVEAYQGIIEEQCEYVNRQIEAQNIIEETEKDLVENKTIKVFKLGDNI